MVDAAEHGQWTSMQIYYLVYLLLYYKYAMGLPFSYSLASNSHLERMYAVHICVI